MPLEIQVYVSDGCRKVQEKRLIRAVKLIATDYGWEQGEVSIAVLSDEEIQILNREHLNHDYPTDVISFDLTEGEEFLEGEVLVSVETADRECVEHEWNGDDELLLYVIHGMLHVVGLRDKEPADIAEMRKAENYYLTAFVPGYDERKASRNDDPV